MLQSGKASYKNILIIDLDPEFIATCQTALSTFDYLTHVASNLEDALLIQEQQKPDAAFCSIQLGAVSGLSVLERLLVKQPRLPVIMMAEESQMSHVLSALRRGAYDYMTKPLSDHHALVYAVQSALASEADESHVQNEMDAAIEELKYNREALLNDRKMASLFQASLLPDQHLECGKLNISWRMPLKPKASRYFLDVLNLSEQYTSFYIADFGDNADDAAFSSGVLKVVFNEALRELDREGSSILKSPEGVMSWASYYLNSLALKPIPSLVYGLLDVSEGTMKWASADFEKGPYIWLESATQLLAETGPDLTSGQAMDYQCNEFMVSYSQPLVFSHLESEQVRQIAQAHSTLSLVSQFSPCGIEDLLAEPDPSDPQPKDAFSFVVLRRKE